MHCLRNTHRVETVGDMMRQADKVDTTKNTNHKRRRNCACQPCKDKRSRGCKNPHKCGAAAGEYVKKLSRQWNPLLEEDKRKHKSDTNVIQSDDAHLFDMNITTKGSLKKGFRVFAPSKCSRLKDINYGREPTDKDYITVYTDGSCKRDKDGHAAAGAGVWFEENDVRNRAIRLPQTIPQMNNADKAVEILEAVKATPENKNVLIKSDSQVTIDNLTKLLRKREDEGWIGSLNRDIMTAIVARMRAQKGLALLEKVKAHSGIVGNKGADTLANLGAEKNTPDDIDLRIPRGYEMPGARLCKMSQAKLYRGIIENTHTPTRRGTIIHLDMMR